MLIMAELLASRPSTGNDLAVGYFSSPTPGRGNSTGIANPGPALRDVTQQIGALEDNEDLVVTAKVTEIAAAVTQVQLHYRVDFGEEISAFMADDGTGSDVTADDGVFTAVIPASARVLETCSGGMSPRQTTMERAHASRPF